MNKNIITLIALVFLANFLVSARKKSRVRYVKVKKHTIKKKVVIKKGKSFIIIKKKGNGRKIKSVRSGRKNKKITIIFSLLNNKFRQVYTGYIFIVSF